MANQQDKPSALRRAREKAAQALAAEREKAAAIESVLTELFVTGERAEPVIARAAERREEAIAKAQEIYARAVAKPNAKLGALLLRLREMGLSESEIVDKTGLTLGEVRRLLRTASPSDATNADSPAVGEPGREESTAGGAGEPLGEDSGGSAVGAVG